MRTSTTSRSTTLVIVSALLAALAATPVSAGSGADVQFGRLSTGSGCVPPECFDDASAHSLDRMLPGAVTVQRGETVEFDVEGFHQVVILEPGVRPRDVEVAGFFVFDPSGPFPDTVVAAGGLPADFAWTPTEPGKYLVICNISPHFEEAQMWGWVHVR